MNHEMQSIPQEAIAQLGKDFGAEDHNKLWATIVREERGYIMERNEDLLQTIYDMIPFGQKVLKPFDAIGYLHGAFGMHRLVRTSGMYTTVETEAMENYKNYQLQRVMVGMANWIQSLHASVEQLAPGALSIFDPTLYKAKFVVSGDVADSIHKPEMILGAADVVIPMAYQLGIFTPQK